MPIILFLLGIITAISIWYWRIRMLRDAAGEAGKVVQTVVNAPRRFAFRYKTGRSGLDLIEDPREAAAIMLVAVACAGASLLTQAQETAIEDQICQQFDFSDGEASDLVEHAKFVNLQTSDDAVLMHKLSARLVSSPGIGPKEIVDFASMLEAVSKVEGQPGAARTALMAIFREKAGLT